MSIPAAALDRFDPFTVYRTADGREAIVVFNGPEEGPATEFRPFHDGRGGIRIGYLNADGTEPDPLTNEYAFHTGDLTPVRVLPKPVQVLFKNEGGDGEDAYGPMKVLYADQPAPGPQPYDPQRPAIPFVTRAEAERTAVRLGVPLIES